MSLPSEERVARWMADLDAALTSADEIVSRGEHAFGSDQAIPLAFEALSNRVGELSKRLIGADPARFSAPIWQQAVRNRDFVVHHYDRIDLTALWVTVSVSFPELHRILQELRADERP